MEIGIIISLVVILFATRGTIGTLRSKVDRYEAILNHEGIVVNGLNHDITGSIRDIQHSEQ